MKKRYMILIAVLFFGFIFWLFFCTGSVCAPTKEVAPLNIEEALAPDRQQQTTPSSPGLPGPRAQKDDMIKVDTPFIGAAVSSPLVVKGYARGNWYFEGSFPIVLTDWQDNVLAQGVATAQGEWMTTGYVPFTATLNYTLPANIGNKTGFLILKKDNPSGEAKFDNQLEINVIFK